MTTTLNLRPDNANIIVWLYVETDLPSGVVGAERSEDGGRTWAPVRTLSEPGASSLWTDNEMLPGIPLLYRGLASDGTTTEYAPVVGTQIEAKVDVLRNVMLPTEWVPVTVESLPELEYDIEQGIFWPLGRTHPVVVSEERHGAEGTLTVVTLTKGERDALWGVVQSGAALVLLPRSGYGQRIYMAAGGITEAMISGVAKNPERRWPIDFVEIDRPLGAALTTFGQTWEHLLDPNATPADLTDDRTWDDVWRIYPNWAGVLATGGPA